jgi:hypothetical protein
MRCNLSSRLTVFHFTSLRYDSIQSISRRFTKLSVALLHLVADSSVVRFTRVRSACVEEGRGGEGRAGQGRREKCKERRRGRIEKQDVSGAEGGME